MADLDPVVARALRITKTGLDEHEKRVRRFDNAYDIYRVTRAPKPKRQDPWRSDLRIPYGMQVINTEMVNIIQGEPRVKVTARHPESEMGALAMQHVLDYFTREDHIAEKQPKFVQCGLIFGVAVAKVHWVYRTANRKQRAFRENQYDPAVPPTSSVEDIKVVTMDRPTFEPWNPYHVYWDPGATDVDSAGYVVLRSYVSKEDLLKAKWNDDTHTGLYHNVEQLLEIGESPPPAGTSQTRALGIGDERYKDKFLVEEIWTDDGLVVIGNQQVLMRGQANPYFHGRKPVVIAQTMPDLFEMEGFSETEALDDLQQALLTVANMRTDNMHLTVARGITYREGGVTDPNDLEIKPRFKWGVADHDDIKPFEVQPLPPEALQEQNSLLGLMQHITGVTDYISGASSVGADQNTATGITALQGAASLLLRFKAQMIQRKGFQRTYELWGDMAQQFLDKPVIAKIVGPGGEKTWLEAHPEDLPGHYDYKMEATEDSLSKQQDRGDAISLFNTLVPLVQAGIIDPKPLVERIGKAFGIDNPESLLKQQPPALPPASPNPGQQAPQSPQYPQLLGGQTMDPAIAQKILGG